MNVDERLSAVFSGLDARPGFNEQLLDRLQAEIAAEARRADEARRQEQLRYRLAQQELHPWKQTLGRWVTLEAGGIAVLAGVIVTSAWSTEQITAALPAALTALGAMLAVAPVLVPMIRSRL